MKVQCAFGCGREIDPDASSTYRRIQGWERKAVLDSRRGGSDISLREQLDEYACPVCIDRLKDGVNVNQTALV